MSILSSFGSAIGSAYNQVKSAVGSAVNYVSSFLPSGSSQTASVANSALKPPPPGPMTPTPTGPNYTVVSKGGNVPNVSYSSVPYGPPKPAGLYPLKPTNLAAGTKTSSSVYSSPSYDPSGLSGTSFAQSSFAGPSNTAVSAGQIGAGTPSINTPSAPSAVNYHGDVIGKNVSLGADPTTGLIGVAGTDPLSSPDAVDAARRKKAFDDYVDKLVKPASQEESYLRAQRESGIQQARQQQQNTQNQINGITAQMNTDLLKLRDTASHEGVVEAVYGGQQAQVTREATIRLLPLQAQLSADQGNLHMAEQNLDTLFNIYSKDAQNSVDFYNSNVKAAYNFMTDEEKIKAETKSKDKQVVLDRIKSDTEDQKNLAFELLKAGNTAGYKALTDIRPPSNTNVSPEVFAQDYANYQRDVANVVTKYGVNIGAMDRNIKQAQLNKLNADAAAALAADAAVNPDVLKGMLNVYKSTGVLPAFGLSAKSPLRAQFYAALGSEGGQQIINDANVNKTVRAGLQTAYKTQQNQLAANQTAIGTLDKQLNLVQQYSDKIGRTDSPLVNKYVIGLRTGVFGDPATAALNNIVKTASYEFAKILSGSAASIAGVTVSSAADAESMLNSAMSKGQFTSVLNLMRQESNFRLNSQQDTLKRLESDMNNVGQLSQDVKDIQSGKISTVDSSVLRSPDGTGEVSVYDLTPAQLEEAKKAGWK